MLWEISLLIHTYPSKKEVVGIRGMATLVIFQFLSIPLPLIKVHTSMRPKMPTVVNKKHNSRTISCKEVKKLKQD